jgi:hypothetical protein
VELHLLDLSHWVRIEELMIMESKLSRTRVSLRADFPPPEQEVAGFLA